MKKLKTIEWVDGAARIIDQTRLPSELVYIDIRTSEQMYEAIKMLRVRGAPAIGIAAAFGIYCGISAFPDGFLGSELIKLLDEKADYIASSRPTAVNLFWAVDRIKKKARSMPDASAGKIKRIVLEEAMIILEEDINMCRKIGEYGFEELKQYNTLLTHCNAGGLATGGYGTALSPVYIGKEKGKIFRVYADETRPLLQGARLTAYELNAAGIPVTLICDNMSAVVMSAGKIDAVIVGADRIAANGDTANKIGTYGLALIAKSHNVPFYVAAPFSTFDLSMKSGDSIPIEERGREEITEGFGRLTAPVDVEVFNPAFDVTPNSLIKGIITERGILRYPFANSIAEAMQS
jgi:methylthioribose-1-phosphate isomerase